MTAPIHPAIDGAARGVLSSAPMVPVSRVIHRSEIVVDPERWVLPEGTVPETKPHANESGRFEQVFRRWADVTERNVLVARNLAVRWDRKRWKIGVDPDVCLIEPPPPEGERVQSLRLWEPGHVPPLLAVEIVSAGHPYKDYHEAPVKYAACNTGELWILDADLVGPRASGGPYRIQVWRKLDDHQFGRVYAGEGPAWSEAVQGWVRYSSEERSFWISSDKAGRKRWLTPEEAERKEKEAAQRKARAERKAKQEERKAREAAQRKAEEERKAREAAEARVRELEARLARVR